MLLRRMLCQNYSRRREWENWELYRVKPCFKWVNDSLFSHQDSGLLNDKQEPFQAKGIFCTILIPQINYFPIQKQWAKSTFVDTVVAIFAGSFSLNGYNTLIPH